MSDAAKTFDMTGVRCPMPIVQLSQIVGAADVGDEFVVSADDPAFAPDVRAWCRRTGNELVELRQQDGVTKARMRKSA